MLKPNVLTVVATTTALVVLAEVSGCNRTENATPPPVPVATAAPTPTQPASTATQAPVPLAAPTAVATPGPVHQAAKAADGGHSALAGRGDAGMQAPVALPTALPPLPQLTALPHPSAAAAALSAMFPAGIPTTLVPPAASGKK